MDTMTTPDIRVQADCPPACPTLLRSLGQHASGCAHWVNPWPPTWCPECRRKVVVEDVHAEDTGDRAVTTEVFSVTDLECGHRITVKTGEYRSPLQQATLPRSYYLSDPFAGEDL